MMNMTYLVYERNSTNTRDSVMQEQFYLVPHKRTEGKKKYWKCNTRVVAGLTAKYPMMKFYLIFSHFSG